MNRDTVLEFLQNIMEYQMDIRDRVCALGLQLLSFEKETRRCSPTKVGPHSTGTLVRSIQKEKMNRPSWHHCSYTSNSLVC